MQEKKSKLMGRLFTLLIQLTVQASFSLPGGRLAGKCIEDALLYLTGKYGEIGLERIVDYCVCQVYVIHHFGDGYFLKWRLSHSFGQKALSRFINRNPMQKYYEDKWLSKYQLTREALLRYIEDRSIHPLHRFVYPDYEDATKHRAVSSTVGYYICGISTLLWTPFSNVCRNCMKSELCKIRTQKLYPEIYRLRIDEYAGKELRDE